jgi:hypothetical protein
MPNRAKRVRNLLSAGSARAAVFNVTPPAQSHSPAAPGNWFNSS